MNTYFEEQKQYELLCEKIQRLKKAHIFETDIPSKLKLEAQIKDAEQELVELENKLIVLEKNKLILNLNGINHQIYCVFSKQATIGRASTCDFVINDDSHTISNLHAGIFYNLEKNEYWLEDLKSANGTYVNEVKIENRTRLSWGAKVKLSSSLSFLFQHNKDDVFSPAVLIQHDANGEEIARYIVIPKGKVLVGTNPKEVVRFPKLRDEHSLGSIERKADGFYFVSVRNEETLLKHNMELSLDFFKVRITIPSVIQKEANNNTNVDDNRGNKREKNEREIVKPTGYEIPPTLRKINIILSLFIFSIGIIFNFLLFKPDRTRISSQWMNECIISLNRKENRSWLEKMIGPQKSHWSSKSSIWPPKESVVYIVSTPPFSTNIDITKAFIDKSGLAGKQIHDDTILNVEDFKQGQFTDLKNKKAPNAPWISIIALESLGSFYLKINYWSPDNSSVDKSTFEWEKKEFLYWHSVLFLLFIIYVSHSIRNWKIQCYRNQLQEHYEIFQKERTKKIFEAKSTLEEARNLAQSANLAQALVIVNSLLKSMSIEMPVYSEVTDLKKMILAQVELGGGALTAQFNKNNGKDFQLGNTSNLLYLRILGTPYAYQAPYGLENISIGRQRRKSGTSVDVGNDVIIRVPGADTKSLRISRRHLEIKRINAEYFVIDKSGGHTKLNGKLLKENEPFRLQTGDRLLIADVLTLEVNIQIRISGSKVGNLIRIDSHNTIQDGLLIETSIGDLITEVSYE
jgi:pSer/pThr/pTyr-binding forkhead associated (FHA) protein